MMYRSVAFCCCLALIAAPGAASAASLADADADGDAAAAAGALRPTAWAAGPVEPPTTAPVLAVGDVGPNSALLWLQADGPGKILVEVDAQGPGAVQRFQRSLDATTDFAVKIPVDGLSPGRRQRWRAVLLDDADEPGPTFAGSFETAPPSSVAAPVRLAWGGDLGGQNVCRDARQGFEIFGAINARDPALFVALGDMIYADGLCEPSGLYGNAQVPGEFGRAADMGAYRAHWRYARADAGVRRLLASSVYLPTWDDHEVVNDFGPLHDTRNEPPYSPGEHLLPIGLAAMLEQNPVAEYPDRPGRLYRSVRWGKHLELLLLDTRQYRDANAAPDSPERPKTLLGREQLTWLKDRLRRSDATWVVIASSVPLSIPTGWPPEGGRDGWADFDQPTGFEQELREILEFAAGIGRKDLLFISADVHFAAAFSYRPNSEQPSFLVHELVAGPLSAGIGATRDYDRDLGTERLFLHAPPSREAVSLYADARRYFSFGELDIAGSGTLEATLRDVDGRVLYKLRLTPEAATRLAGVR
jgi:alkaline phosphatase D